MATTSTTVRLTVDKLGAMLMVWDENHGTNVESEARNFTELGSFQTRFDHDDSADMRAFLESL